jgi:hypothetical protein
MKTINRLDRYYPIIALFVAAVVSFVFWQSCGGGQIPFGITPVQPIQEEEEEPVVEAGLAIKGMVVPPAAGTPSLSAQVNEMLKALTADDFTVTITKGGSEIASCPVVGSSYSCSFSEELVSSGELVEGDILFVSTDNYELQSVCRFSLEPTDECNCGLTDTATTLAYWLTENTVDILSNVSAQVADNLSDVSPQCELYQKGCEFFRRDLPDVSGPCSFDVDNPPNIYSLNLLKQFYMDNFSEGIKPATLNYLSLDNTTPTRFFEFLWENPEANINALAMLREQFTASIFALAKPW